MFIDKFLGSLGLSDLTTVTTIIRLLLAIICGGLIGMERERKRRPAGFRTYILVCLGAALTMMISQYLSDHGLTTDAARLGAQVISGVGFLGAGTIIVTSRQQVKGLTTAAGLWASACMGLAIGAGYYEGAIYACILILLTFTLLNKFNSFLMSTARNMNIYVEYMESDDMGSIIEALKKIEIKIIDIEMIKSKVSDDRVHSAVFTIEMKKKMVHADIMTRIASTKGVRQVEEL